MLLGLYYEVGDGYNATSRSQLQSRIVIILFSHVTSALAASEDWSLPRSAVAELVLKGAHKRSPPDIDHHVIRYVIICTVGIAALLPKYHSHLT